MSARNVRDFMGEDSRELIFIFEDIDEAFIDIDIAAGSGEGVNRRAGYNGKVEII